MTQLLKEDYSGFDYNLLEKLVPKAVRFLDNVNDLSYVPTGRQQRNLQEKRRIGLGHFGDGSALVMMKKRYGSEEAFNTMRQFQKRLANLAYQASAQLAKEKEPFPLFDKEHYLNEAPFIQRLSSKTKEMIAAYGLRNSHLLSIQPTGNTSTLANAPSSGIEPVFMHEYTRTAEQPALPSGVEKPNSIDWDNLSDGEIVETKYAGTMWEAEKQGDEIVLRCIHDGLTHWQIHPTRGIVKDQQVEDYAKRNMSGFDADADWAITTRDLDVDDHLTMMKAVAPFVDSAISKTVNVPQDYLFEDFKGLYRDAHAATAVKGVTTYRAGTMSAVLSGSEDKEDADGIPRTEAPKRPEELPCALHNIRYSGDIWRIVIGFYQEEPYEVFAFKTQGNSRLDRVVDSSGQSFEEGTVRKAGSGHYQLIAPDAHVAVENITEHAPSDSVREETRLISTALRHGANLKFVVKQLEKAEGSIASFGNCVAKALANHLSGEVTCDKCGSSNVIFEEGCLRCADCGYSCCS
jgi:ribonucleoside-diphosphate reductase alpha chain